MNFPTKAVRINGCGIWFLGVKNTEERGVVFATFWLTFLFLPIIPLGRAKIHFQDTRHYNVIEKLPLQAVEVLATYAYGWLLFPLLILGPTAIGLALAINEILTSLGAGLVIVGVVWAIFVTWQLASWDEYRHLVKQTSLLFPRLPR